MSEAEDNREQLKELIEEVLQDQDTEPHHYTEPVPKQFAHLPRDVRLWLLQLDHDDINAIRDAVELSRSLKRVGRLTKIVILAVPFIATTVVTFIDNIHHIGGWIKDVFK